MDDEFREFETSNLEIEFETTSTLIRRSAISAIHRYSVGKCGVFLNTGQLLIIYASYEEVRAWLTRADAPATLDAFGVKKSETTAAPGD